MLIGDRKHIEEAIRSLDSGAAGGCKRALKQYAKSAMASRLQTRVLDYRYSGGGVVAGLAYMLRLSVRDAWRGRGLVRQLEAVYDIDGSPAKMRKFLEKLLKYSEGLVGMKCLKEDPVFTAAAAPLTCVCNKNAQAASRKAYEKLCFL